MVHLIQLINGNEFFFWYIWKVKLDLETYIEVWQIEHTGERIAGGKHTHMYIQIFNIFNIYF